VRRAGITPAACVSTALPRPGCVLPQDRRGAILSCVLVTGDECFHVKIVSATDAERTAPSSEAFYRDARGDANLTIFESVYPPDTFMQTCGYEKLKECVENGEIEVIEDIAKARDRVKYYGRLMDRMMTIEGLP